jgi:hypothetical protein
LGWELQHTFLVTTEASIFKNVLLRKLDPDLIARLALKSVVFHTGQGIEQPGQTIERLFFLESGMASMTTIFAD